MSKWTHSICWACWELKNPSRIAHRIIPAVARTEQCCFCGTIHRTGIYVRQEPSKPYCGGTHQDRGDSIPLSD